VTSETLSTATAGAGAAGARLAQAAADALAADPSRPSIEFEGRWTTWGELRQMAEAVADLVERATADPRAPIVFAPRNRPSAIAALLGLIAGARNIRMMYVYQSPDALAGNLGRLNGSILVAAAEDFTPPVVEALRSQGCAGIALHDTGADFVPGLERVIRETDANAPVTPTFEMLTSGTTGPAKLWPLTYELLEQRFIRGNSVFADADADSPPTLLCYPLCNVSGLYTVVPASIAGLPMILQNKFTLEGWLEYIGRFSPPDIYLPPVGVQMVLDANLPREALGKAEFCRCGMTSLPVEVQRAFEDRYQIPILIAYGATEFGGVVAQMSLSDAKRWGQQKIGSTGRAFGEAKLRVVDPQTGVELPADQPGALEVLLPSVMADWTRTSDIARIDADGFVFILGRADGAISRGGFKILPETVESALIQHPKVAAAVVVGIADRRLGQVPAALVEQRQGAGELTVQELEEHIRRHVPATHVPVSWRIVDQLPRTPSLKVNRKAVKDLFEPTAEPEAG
jgi:long-chain acyl-CoA synthetase